MPFFDPFQMYTQFMHYRSNFFEPKSSNLSIPSMAEFLKEIDKKEETNNYYQNFLENFETQRISVRNLCTLTDDEYKECGINIIGVRRTIRDYAEKYKNY